MIKIIEKIMPTAKKMLFRISLAGVFFNFYHNILLSIFLDPIFIVAEYLLLQI